MGDKMYSVDDIIEMLDWNNDEETQKTGIELAKGIKNLYIFVQPPIDKKYWENCAKVVASHCDSELISVLNKLFHWVADLNWPGSEIILERLNRFERTELFEVLKKNAINYARIKNDNMWLYNLNLLN